MKASRRSSKIFSEIFSLTLLSIFIIGVYQLYPDEGTKVCEIYFDGLCPYGSCSGGPFITEWPCKVKGCNVEPGYVECIPKPPGR